MRSLAAIAVMPMTALLALVTLGCVGLRPFEEVHAALDPAAFVDLNGQRVHVETRGEGEPLLLVHGFGGSTYSWRKVVPALARRFRTIAIDLNGFGYTERPRQRTAYSRTGQLAVLTGVMDSLGIDSAHFIGHSYGGGLALTLAHQQPERVRSVIAVDSVTPKWAAKGRRNQAVFGAPLAPFYVRGLALRHRYIARALRRSFHDDDLVTPDLVEAYRDRLRIEGASRAFRSIGRPANTPEDRASAPFAEIEQATLILWCREDPLIPLEKGRQAAEQLPRGYFEVLEDCGHTPMEERPDEFVREVEAFLLETGAQAG